jgi:hypothetical protein
MYLLVAPIHAVVEGVTVTMGPTCLAPSQATPVIALDERSQFHSLMVEPTSRMVIFAKAMQSVESSSHISP